MLDWMGLLGFCLWALSSLRIIWRFILNRYSQNMAANMAVKIAGAVAGAFAISYACDYLMAEKKIFGGQFGWW